MDYQSVLSFWFTDIDEDKWWAKDPVFDELISTRFATLLQRAKQGELFGWRDCAAGRLAEIIVLDQFSRNIFRDTAHAFEQDAQALALAQEAVAGGFDKHLSIVQRAFLYMPYMHSESLLIHEQAIVLFNQQGMEYNLDFERKHKIIIEKFGRFPHRNAQLKRQSTATELEFLKQPGSGF